MFDQLINATLGGEHLNGTFDQFDGHNMLSGHCQVNGNMLNMSDSSWHPTGYCVVNGNSATVYDSNHHVTEHHTRIGNIDTVTDAHHRLIETHTTMPNGNVITANANGTLTGISNQHGAYNPLGEKIQAFKKIF